MAPCARRGSVRSLRNCVCPVTLSAPSRFGVALPMTSKLTALCLPPNSPADHITGPTSDTRGCCIFADQAVYDYEMEKICRRAWLMIGHGSLLPQANYFVKS